MRVSSERFAAALLALAARQMLTFEYFATLLPFLIFPRLCRDSTKKFCPSCGNPALIRASITTKRGSSGEAITQVHLKKNFQYRTRGTKYSIPEPKMGSAKGQKHGGTGLILREDQREFQNGVRREEIRRHKEDRALERVMKAQQEGKGGYGGAVGGGWNDPDVSPLSTAGLNKKTAD